MPDDLSARVEAFLDRVAAIRWMQPDAAMDACDPDAIQWCADRVEEHLAALGYTDEELPSPLVTVERDLITADNRWTSLWTVVFEASRKPSARLAARDYLQRAERTMQRSTPSILLDASDRFLALRRAIAARTEEYERSGLTIDTDFLGLRQAEQILRESADPDVVSPWKPLLAVWERGVFPLMMPDRSAMLFVPHADGRVVPERRGPFRNGVLGFGPKLIDGLPAAWVMQPPAVRPIPSGARGRIATVSPEPPRPRPQPRRPRRGEGD